MRESYRLAANSVDEIVRLKGEGLSLKEIGQRTGHDWKTIKKYLAQRDVSSETPRWRKWPCDETFFEVIDTEEKAYWLGFISADGHIEPRGFSVSLAAKDREHLEKLKKALKTEYPLTEKKNKEGNVTSITLSVGSIKLRDDLKALGLEHNKTFNLEPCNEIPKPFLRDYWRGVVDGDGCIHLSKRGAWRVDLTGTKEIVEGFKKDASFYTRTNPTPRKRENARVWAVVFGGSGAAASVLLWLYEGALVFLDRKMALAKDCAIQAGTYI